MAKSLSSHQSLFSFGHEDPLIGETVDGGMVRELDDEVDRDGFVMPGTIFQSVRSVRSLSDPCYDTPSLPNISEIASLGLLPPRGRDLPI